MLHTMKPCVHSKKSGIIGDMKKEYQATNYESDLADEQ